MRLYAACADTWYMEGKKTILPHLTTIVINIIYNNGVHLGHFKDFEMKGVDTYYNNTGGITT